MKIAITDKQKVFSCSEGDRMVGLFGPMLRHFQVPATYEAGRHSKASLFLLGPGYLQIGGAVAGKIRTDLAVDNSSSILAL